MFAGVQLGLGFNVDILFVHTAWQDNLLRLETLILQASGPFATVTISPSTATVTRGATQQFDAMLVGQVPPGITWSADGGTINPDGLYIAPQRAGIYHVTATSSAESSATDSATVTVPAVAPKPPTRVTATPTSAGASVSWTAPADDGGAPISSYIVTASPGDQSISTDGSTTSAEFHGLDPAPATCSASPRPTPPG